MNRIIRLVILLFLSISSFAANDSLTISDKAKIDEIANQLKEVRRDELNYKIEKDLLKETYSNNYERISLIITIVLGIIGVLGYLGIKDINSIKREYALELEKLKQFQTDIVVKFKDFEASKERYDTELNDILKTNEDQNRKIKVLELKEKISSLLSEKQYSSALEYCAVALELSANDHSLLLYRGIILSKLNRLDEAIDTYERLMELGDVNQTIILNLAELYLFKNKIDKVENLVKNHERYFLKKRDIKLLDFFDLFKKYHENDINGIKEYATTIIDKQNPDTLKQFKNWDFSDALTFVYEEADSEKKNMLRAILFYLNGQMTGSDLNKTLQLNLFSAKT